MIVSFKDEGAEDIFNGKSTKAARKTCPKPVWKIAARKLDQLDSVTTPKRVADPTWQLLGSLEGRPRRQHSIRINDQYRISFVWTDAGPDKVEVVDYH